MAESGVFPLHGTSTNILFERRNTLSTELACFWYRITIREEGMLIHNVNSETFFADLNKVQAWIN